MIEQTPLVQSLWNVISKYTKATILDELIAERNSGTTNGQLLAVAERMPVNFDKVMEGLLTAVESKERFELHLLALQEKGVLDKDDYTLVIL